MYDMSEEDDDIVVVAAVSLLLAAHSNLKIKSLDEKRRKGRECWMNPWNAQSETSSVYNHLVSKMSINANVGYHFHFQVRNVCNFQNC